MMPIPVTFTYLNKTHHGELSQVMGAGSSATWHLYANNFYWGSLSYTDRWTFNSQDGALKEYAEEFGSCVVSALDSAT